MSGTYNSLHVHIVFSTKARRPKLEKAWLADLHEYIGGTVRGLDAHPIITGGTEDHVHILIGVKPKHQLSNLVRQVKLSSGAWVRDKQGIAGFGWQDGYGAFSIAREQVPVVRAYIEKQEEHRRRVTPRDEFIALCLEFGLNPDEKFVE